MRDPTSKFWGLGQGTVPLFDYTLVSDSYFRVRDPTSKFLGLGQGTVPLFDYTLVSDSYVGVLQ